MLEGSPVSEALIGWECWYSVETRMSVHGRVTLQIFWFTDIFSVFWYTLEWRRALREYFLWEESNTVTQPQLNLELSSGGKGQPRIPILIQRGLGQSERWRQRIGTDWNMLRRIVCTFNWWWTRAGQGLWIGQYHKTVIINYLWRKLIKLSFFIVISADIDCDYGLTAVNISSYDNKQQNQKHRNYSSLNVVTLLGLQLKKKEIRLSLKQKTLP